MSLLYQDWLWPPPWLRLEWCEWWGENGIRERFLGAAPREYGRLDVPEWPGFIVECVPLFLGFYIPSVLLCTIRKYRSTHSTKIRCNGLLCFHSLRYWFIFKQQSRITLLCCSFPPSEENEWRRFLRSEYFFSLSFLLFIFQASVEIFLMFIFLHWRWRRSWVFLFAIDDTAGLYCTHLKWSYLVGFHIALCPIEALRTDHTRMNPIRFTTQFDYCASAQLSDSFIKRNLYDLRGSPYPVIRNRRWITSSLLSCTTVDAQ